MIIKVACLQIDVEWGREKSNVEKAIKAIESLPDKEIHILCLPELFTTGYDYDYLKVRDHSITNEILERFTEKAKERGVYIFAGTLPEKEEEALYNSLFIITPEGEREVYRKIHLFPLMGENRFFAPGRKILVYKTPWAKIGTAICYDLRFPELFQSMALKGAQVIIIPAQFPSPRIEHWNTLLKARAIENQLFVVGVNRVGEDKAGQFPGHTSVYDPMGRLIAGREEGEGWVIGSVDLEEIEQVRHQIPALFYHC